jgi:small-conductance mechanosensitive channel
MLLGNLFKFSPDETAGNGEATQAPTPAQSEAGNATEEKSGKTFTQADVENIVKERLERAQKQAEKKAADAAKAAEEKALADNSEFQKLAEKRAAELQELSGKVQTLEQVQEKAKRYEKSLSTFRDQLIAGVSPAILELLKSRDIADQLDWLIANPQNGNKTPFPTTPDPKGNGLSKEEIDNRTFRPRF